MWPATSKAKRRRPIGEVVWAVDRDAIVGQQAVEQAGKELALVGGDDIDPGVEQELGGGVDRSDVLVGGRAEHQRPGPVAGAGRTL